MLLLLLFLLLLMRMLLLLQQLSPLLCVSLVGIARAAM